MPELPEVETVIREINLWIEKEKISNFPIKKIEFIGKNPFPLFDNIIGKKIIKAKRKGKWILFNFENDNNILACHLRMTGKFFFEKPKDPCIILTFSENKSLFFCDTRKFAVFQLKKMEDIENMNIGYDIMNDEINKEEIFKKFQKDKRNIKNVLLDQKIICGIGNIYASEILFYCKINPLKITKEITKREFEEIISNSKKILDESIKMGGTSVVDFVSPFGTKGKYQEKLKVYMRLNKPCYECKQKIKKISINGRGTYFCSSCQK